MPPKAEEIIVNDDLKNENTEGTAPSPNLLKELQKSLPESTEDIRISWIVEVRRRRTDTNNNSDEDEELEEAARLRSIELPGNDDDDDEMESASVRGADHASTTQGMHKSSRRLASNPRCLTSHRPIKGDHQQEGSQPMHAATTTTYATGCVVFHYVSPPGRAHVFSLEVFRITLARVVGLCAEHIQYPAAIPQDALWRKRGDARWPTTIPNPTPRALLLISAGSVRRPSRSTRTHSCRSPATRRGSCRASTAPRSSISCVRFVTQL